MFVVTLRPQKHIVQYTEKWRGYTARVDFKELSKYQKEMHERIDATPISKCIVYRDGAYAWRYYRDGRYVYHRINKDVPAEVFRKYFVQYIYASRVTWQVR